MKNSPSFRIFSRAKSKVNMTQNNNISKRSAYILAAFLVITNPQNIPKTKTDLN